MPHPSRIKAAQSHLVQHNYDAMLIQEPKTLYYFTGLHFSVGSLIILKDTARLIVDGRYIEAAKENSPVPVVLNEGKAFEELFRKQPFSDIKTLAFDSHFTTHHSFTQLQKKTPSTIQLTPVDYLVETLRVIKDQAEIKALTAAAELGSAGYDFVCDLLREGITEKEVATELEIFWLKNGADGLAFDPIIAFGTHTSMPHYHPDHTVLEKNQPVLIDIGVSLNSYQSDMTRVVFFGEPDPKMIKIYDIVKEAQQAALDACRPGLTTGELDASARDIIKKAGYGEQFSHSLGHGIGLEVHESPYLRHKGEEAKLTIQPGMLVTIEPGIYLPNHGGVRIEDTILVTEEGYQNLTNRSKELRLLTPEAV